MIFQRLQIALQRSTLGFVMINDVLLAGAAGVFWGAVQLWLLWRVLRVRSGFVRGALLMLKTALWAAGFVGVVVLLGTMPLVAFAGIGGAVYLIAAGLFYLRNIRKR
jgi:hypothetical protein